MSKDANDFARSVLDQIIAKHGPDASRGQRKHPRAVALGVKGCAKGGISVRTYLHRSADRLRGKQQKQGGPSARLRNLNFSLEFSPQLAL